MSLEKTITKANRALFLLKENESDSRLSAMDVNRLTCQIYTWGKSLFDISNSLNKCNLPQQYPVGELWDVVIFLWLHAWRSKVQRFPCRLSGTGSRLVKLLLNTINSMSTNERHISLKCGCLPLKVETGGYRATKTNTEDLWNPIAQVANSFSELWQPLTTAVSQNMQFYQNHSSL